MKTVFSNSELPHIWARQSQTEGRTSNGSMFFSGGVLTIGCHKIERKEINRFAKKLNW
jgi:hypothetical protein